MYTHAVGLCVVMPDATLRRRACMCLVVFVALSIDVQVSPMHRGRNTHIAVLWQVCLNFLLVLHA